MDIIRTYLTTSRISQPASLRGKAVRHLELTSIRRLIPIFAAWKGLILLIALASPGPGYDTSTRILFDRQRGEHDSWFAYGLEHVLLRLTRWDGIYFASGSAHGQVYEQEWAFSPLLSRATSTVARGVFYRKPVARSVRLSTTLFQSSSRPCPSPPSPRMLSPASWYHNCLISLRSSSSTT